MTIPSVTGWRRFGATSLVVALAAAPMSPALAAKVVKHPPATALAPKTAAPAPVGPAKASGTSILPGASSKEPINIDAGKLDYFDKEQKLVYTGDVVAVQGESTLKASVLTILLQKDQPAAGAPAPPPGAPAAPAMGPGAGSSVSHMEADGPVTMISKDQVGTGDHGTYDKAENKVYLKGHVTLSQGTNVTQGDRLIYDMTSGQAQVFSDKPNGGRVSSVFTPGSGASPSAQPPAATAPAAPVNSAASPKRKAAKAAKPAPVAADDAAAQ